MLACHLKPDCIYRTTLSRDMHTANTDVFRDLDDKIIFAEDLAAIEQSTCGSCAVQFNTDTASSCVKVNDEIVQTLLCDRGQSRDPSTCLWKNLWGWSQENQSILAAIARHYELSPRLARSICPSTPAKRAEPASTNIHGNRPAANMPRSVAASSMADVFEAVWHFGSVDFGHHYICLG